MEAMKKEMVEKKDQIIELGDAKELTLGLWGSIMERWGQFPQI